MNLISTSKFYRSIEALLEVIFKLVAIYAVYEAFNWFVSCVLNKNLAEDTLLSLLLLPALYILKDFDSVLDPATVVIEQHPGKISVKRGFAPKVKDTLEFKNVENIEVITSLLGRLLDYSTIRLYSPGGLVEMPYVYGAEAVVEDIDRAKKNT
jgi:Bacterial PH domain